MNRLFVSITNSFGELIVGYLAVIFIATAAFAHFEHRTVGDSLWWAFVTAVTVGYGDISPATVGGRVTAVLLMHVVPLVIIPLIVARLIKLHEKAEP